MVLLVLREPGHVRIRRPGSGRPGSGWPGSGWPGMVGDRRSAAADADRGQREGSRIRTAGPREPRRRRCRRRRGRWPMGPRCGPAVSRSPRRPARRRNRRHSGRRHPARRRRSRRPGRRRARSWRPSSWRSAARGRPRRPRARRRCASRPPWSSYVRLRSRPLTITRVPRVSDSATFSAASRHTEHRMKRVSPSFHSFDCRSNVRGVEATVKFATAAPEGVKRSSGSLVRLPMMVMTVSPAMAGLPSSVGDLSRRRVDQRAARRALMGSGRISLVRRTASLRLSCRSSSFARSGSACMSTTA